MVEICDPGGERGQGHGRDRFYNNVGGTTSGVEGEVNEVVAQTAGGRGPPSPYAPLTSCGRERQIIQCASASTPDHRVPRPFAHLLYCGVLVVLFAGGVNMQLPFRVKGAGRLHVYDCGAHAGDRTPGMGILVTRTVVPAHSLSHIQQKERLKAREGQMPGPTTTRLRLFKPARRYRRTSGSSSHLWREPPGPSMFSVGAREYHLRVPTICLYGL